MSQKKHKKRHAHSSSAVRTNAEAERLADRKDRDRKRMNPTARTLLLGDMVFLAIAQLLYDGGMLSDTVSGACTILGIILLILGLYFQFGKGSRSKLK